MSFLTPFFSHFFQRRDYRILAEALPPKHEFVVAIRMSPVQDQLIVRYLEKNSGYHTSSDLFSTFSNLSKVHVYTTQQHNVQMYTCSWCVCVPYSSERKYMYNVHLCTCVHVHIIYMC